MWPSAVGWLHRLRDDGTLICSVCTGSLLLAEAGLLNGLAATTHWSAADLITLAPENETYRRLSLMTKLESEKFVVGLDWPLANFLIFVRPEKPATFSSRYGPSTSESSVSIGADNAIPLEFGCCRSEIST